MAYLVTVLCHHIAHFGFRAFALGITADAMSRSVIIPNQLVLLATGSTPTWRIAAITKASALVICLVLPFFEMRTFSLKNENWDG